MLRWRSWLGLASAAVVMGLVGCATPQSRPRLVKTGDPVVDGWMAITNGPVEDRVLWQYRTSLELIRRDEFAQAASLLDSALAMVANRYGANASARKSRGYFASESSKTYLGEPYERSMAYIYRGLLYWRSGEIDNARACFRSAQVEDSDTENQEYSGDIVLADYLDALGTHRLSGDGFETYQRATNTAKLAVPKPLQEVGNVLFFVDYGEGPEKFATGQYREKLKFRDGGSDAVEVMLQVAKQGAIHLGPLDDLSYQATTRGGRVMDYVLENKAVFKGATDAVGDVALVSGMVLAQDQKTRGAGLGLAAVGVLSKLLAEATTPAADTRTWDNLPKFLAFGSMRLPPGQYQLTVQYLNDQRQIIGAKTQSIPITVNAPPRDTVILVSEHDPKASSS
jgi:hypothetical protein